ncbi:MAG: tetratricopeptide repeat protein, partial [Thermoanaerobaculia bacterium]
MRRRVALAGVLLAAVAAAGLWFVHIRQGNLARGRTERGVLQPGSPRSWWVAMERDEHAEVVVSSDHAAISARLVDSSGELRRMLPADDSGLLVLRWTSDREGRWRIEVDPGADPGSGSSPVEYSIELTAVRAATAQDRLDWEAEAADEQVRQALAGSGGDGDRALDLLPRAVATREKLLRGDPRRLARYLNDLATGLARGCDATPERWRSSESLLVRASRLYESSGPAPAPEAAETLANLAIVASFQGHWDQAERFQRRVLDLDRKHLPPDDLEFGYDLVGLASTRFEQGHYSEVEPLLSQALEISQAADPPDGYLIADVFNRLGELHRALGSYGDAEESFDQAYRQARESLPEGDLFFADLANNLAGIHRDLGEHYKSELLLQRALQLCEASAACCPRRLASARLNLAEILRIQGDFERAGPLYSSALALAMSSMAEDDPGLAMFLNQQGLFFAEQDDREQAILFYEEARAVTERAFGREHPMVALSIQDLARLHMAAGRPAKAEALYLQALAIRRSRLGERHPETA